MTKQEFEDRTGMKVSAEEYDRIENIYLAAGEMDKDEFCREFRAHGHSPLVAELFKTCQSLEEQRLEQVDKTKELKKRIDDCAKELILQSAYLDEPSLYKQAVGLIGRREAILTRLGQGRGIDTDDLAYVKNLLP